MVEALSFGIIDITILVLLVLFLLGGLRSGFLREVYGITSILGAGAIAYFLAGVAGNVLISQFGFDTLIYDAVSEPLLSLFTQELVQGITLNSLGLDAEVIAFGVTYASLITMGYVAVFFVAVISLLLMFAQLIRLTRQLFLVGLVDKLLGLVVGLVRAVIVVAVIMLFVSTLSLVVPAIETFITADLSLESDNFSIGKFLYDLIIDLISPYL
jgi:uncharacterized membrane protein required for colicin V production